MNWLMSLWAGVAVLGFAMVFAVPRGTLPGIALLAIGAHLLRSVCLENGASLPLASFVAALAVGFTAGLIAPRTGQATPIYAFPPVIPLVPGTYMFSALTGLFQLTAGRGGASSVIIDEVVVSVSAATLTLVALAVGAIGPSLLIGRRLASLVVREALEDTEG